MTVDETGVDKLGINVFNHRPGNIFKMFARKVYMGSKSVLCNLLELPPIAIPAA